jgi:small nuclear ribonucleoprotein (snRNP)-like protein
MPSALTITIIFIILATVVGAFVRRRCRDKCLKDFSNNMVTLEETSGKRIWGQLRVENTGLELIYPEKQRDADGHDEASYILYKYEYPNISALVQFHDELSQENRRRRQAELKRTYHPTLLRRLKRKILNVFKTLRDSVLEVLNVLISQAKRTTPAGSVLSSQDKYVTQMKQELFGAVGTSFEPLLEKYIGHKVVLELTKADRIFEYCGVLKDYTAEFIEIMDVEYKAQQDKAAQKADLVVLRKYGTVRHLGE